jgi:hypothetical protein
MILKYTKGKPWYEVLAVILVGLLIFTIILAILHGQFPNSGLTHAIHSVGQVMAKITAWIGVLFTQIIAPWFASW